MITDTANRQAQKSRAIRDAARDAVRNDQPMVRFVAASLTSAALDFALLMVFKRATGNLLLSVVLARLTSATVNYLLNRNYVFRARLPRAKQPWDKRPWARRPWGRRPSALKHRVRRIGRHPGAIQAPSYSFVRYASLAAIIMFLNYGILAILHETAGIPLASAKLATELTLYLFSYWAQSRFVFPQRRLKPARRTHETD